MKRLLKPTGVITMEFPHLLRLMEQNQFDTIYHEHFSYFSFLSVERVFAAHGLTLFDVEELPTHGGSIRIYGRHTEDATKPVSERASAPDQLSFKQSERPTDRSDAGLIVTWRNSMTTSDADSRRQQPAARSRSVWMASSSHSATSDPTITRSPYTNERHRR